MTDTWTGTASPTRARAGSWLAPVGAVLAVGAAAVASALAGRVVLDAVRGVDAVPWVLARASGVTSYVLLVALVTTGLVLAHPWARHLRRPSAATRLVVHASLATFTLAFTVLHVVVLATDPWAQVGWAGALLPMASAYRPVPVTLGVLALWAGLLTGVTARWAGRVGRVWLPVHRVALVVLALVWAHGVLAGSDTPALQGFYLATGAAVAALAVSRYGARTPRELVGAGVRGAA